MAACVPAANAGDYGILTVIYKNHRKRHLLVTDFTSAVEHTNPGGPDFPRPVALPFQALGAPPGLCLEEARRGFGTKVLEGRRVQSSVWPRELWAVALVAMYKL